MASDAGVSFDQRSGRGSRPDDSAGYSTPVGLPKPKSRRYAYCSPAGSRGVSFAMAMLLDTRSPSRRVSHSYAWTSVCTRPCGSVHRPRSAYTRSPSSARPAPSRVETKKGLRIDPAS